MCKAIKKFAVKAGVTAEVAAEAMFYLAMMGYSATEIIDTLTM